MRRTTKYYCEVFGVFSIELNCIYLSLLQPAICDRSYFLNLSSEDDLFHMLPLYNAVHAFQSLIFYL